MIDKTIDAQTEASVAEGSAGAPSRPLPENAAVANRLRDFADLLQQQGEGGFRERAYRRGSETVSALSRPVSAILSEQGWDGLVALPGIGRSIAAAIAEMVATGRWSQLERLRGELVPEVLFLSLPGIGPKLAHRLAEDADLETLEELEAALHLGNLDVPGLGPRRRRMLSAVLAERLGRPVAGVDRGAPEPPVSLLLEVDRMYREKAEAGALRKIAPKRFNPSGEAWLPVLHARHAPWHFTALYSNTARAHDLGKTKDWVVIYFHADDMPEGRRTVVSEIRGPLAGQRVVRGREREVDEEGEAHALS
ncbi:helix-hairpin-helix domain-containing protein [Breoghania sp.]|uniref:helix-hairpin-helix domain-containing protein n=1 Tax=Breoghania sp. TaxID=2065378 RepID=UPI002AA661DF|nr:helix-hairpin-helix domain-containing protein [Breoghania sp.]